MAALSHSPARLSMRALLGLGMLALAGPALSTAAPGEPSPYYGRWTVSEDKPIFTDRGRLYKTIDVAPCGNDFCGVSVGDKGQCGATLFRFAGRHAGTDSVRGHGKWGDVQKDLAVFTEADPAITGGHSFELYLGDGHDLGSRSGSMPKFHAYYRRLRGAVCKAG